MLIIDSTPELVSTGRFAFERVPAIMRKGKRDQVELWVARAKALVSSSRSAASAPVADGAFAAGRRPGCGGSGA